MKKILKNKKEITAWLDKYNIKNYTLIEDVDYGYVVDVTGDIFLYNRELKFIPVKFNIVSGEFQCSLNSLMSLEFAPSIVGHNFHCSCNEITSLKGGPNSVGGDFSCSGNKLRSLQYCPTSVGGAFRCDSNQLINLAHCPTSVGDGFYCYYNTSLGDYQSITDFIVLKDKLNSDREKLLLSVSLVSPIKTVLHKV